jgi:hypothetical protein
VRSGVIAKSTHPDEQPKFEVDCVDKAVDMILQREKEEQQQQRP